MKLIQNKKPGFISKMIKKINDIINGKYFTVSDLENIEKAFDTLQKENEDLKKFIKENRTHTIIRENKSEVKKLEKEVDELKQLTEYYKSEAFKAREMEKLAWKKLYEIKSKLDKCSFNNNLLKYQIKNHIEILEIIKHDLQQLFKSQKKNKSNINTELYV